MQIERLTKIAIIMTIVSLITLYSISTNINLEEKQINKINNEDIESQLTINGKINRITELEDVYFLELQQISKITIVVFKDEKINIEKDDYVEIEGKVDEYNNNLQIIANKIIKK